MRNTKIRLVAIVLAAAMMIGDTSSVVYAAEPEQQTETAPETEDTGDDTDAGDESGDDADAGDKSGNDEGTGDKSGDDEDTGDESGDDADAGDESGDDAAADETGDEEAEPEKTEEDADEAADEDKDTETEEAADGETVLSDELAAKLDTYVYGSDGIAHDGIEYITWRAYLALDEEEQETYIEFCDGAATYASENELDSPVVISTNEDGEVAMGYFVAFEELDEAFDVPDGVDTEDGDDDQATEETSEDAEETPADETPADDETEAAEEKEEVKEDSEEASPETETADVIDSFDELSDEDKAELGIDAPVSENEDDLADVLVEEETFEVVDDTPLDINIDLSEDTSIYAAGGEENSTADYDTLYPTNMSNYFYKQLTSAEKKIYNKAKSNYLNGKNSFSFTAAYSYSIGYQISNALSALINTYPSKSGWMAKGYGGWSCSMKGTYRKCTVTVTVTKSSYYTSDIQAQANTAVNNIVTAAWNALNDSTSAYYVYRSMPTYGMVRYFDDWICNNNDYNYNGTTYGSNYNAYSREYWLCHSQYGILLAQDGVCESYALAMTCLLDKAGIPNIYVVGNAGGGHAWNYVYMPNGKWYLQDSTWNDNGYKNRNGYSDRTGSSDYDYLLVPGDYRTPTGMGYNSGKYFKYPSLTTGSRYDSIISSEPLTVASYKILAPKKKVTLAVNSFYKNYSKKWTSSNSKVAKVDKKGKVTAVKPGVAKITVTVGKISASTIIVVYKFSSLKFANNNKTKLSLTYKNEDAAYDSTDIQTVTINVNQSGGVAGYTIPGTSYTCDAATLKSLKGIANPKITGSKGYSKVAQIASWSITGNQLVLNIQPKAAGSATFTIKYAGKTAKLKFTVKQKIQDSWFTANVDPTTVYDDNDGNGAIPHLAYKKGKAVNLKIAKTAECPKGVTYKLVYKNNKKKNALATVSLVGTKYYYVDTATFPYYNYKYRIK